MPLDSRTRTDMHDPPDCQGVRHSACKMYSLKPQITSKSVDSLANGIKCGVQSRSLFRWNFEVDRAPPCVRAHTVLDDQIVAEYCYGSLKYDFWNIINQQPWRVESMLGRMCEWARITCIRVHVSCRVEGTCIAHLSCNSTAVWTWWRGAAVGTALMERNDAVRYHGAGIGARVHPRSS